MELHSEKGWIGRVAWRYLPLVGVSLLCLVAFIWRPWLQLRRHGTRGILLFQPGKRAQFVRECLGVLLLVLLMGQAIAAAWWPEALSPLGAEHEWIEVQRWSGVALLLGGIVLLVAAQLDLDASWRIGIEEGASPGLVTGGLYRFCRNPIFLALIFIVAGYALLLPTRLSLILLAGACIGVRQQVSAEEEYLLRAYADGYRAYARRVGRFLPWLGRLR